MTRAHRESAWRALAMPTRERSPPERSFAACCRCERRFLGLRIGPWRRGELEGADAESVTVPLPRAYTIIGSKVAYTVRRSNASDRRYCDISLATVHNGRRDRRRLRG